MALNRGNARHDIFFKDADFEAFERIVAEGLERCSVDLICYQWMSNQSLAHGFVTSSCPGLRRIYLDVEVSRLAKIECGVNVSSAIEEITSCLTGQDIIPESSLNFVV